MSSTTVGCAAAGPPRAWSSATASSCWWATSAWPAPSRRWRSPASLPLVQSLATTVTEMAEGEVAQLERAGNPDATVDDYFRVIDRKTASLIAWCARVGGSVGQTPGRAAGALRPGAGPGVPDRGRRARQRDRRGDRRQVGRPRSAGRKADAPGAAGLRGRPGAGAPGPRPAGRDGGPRLRRRGDPDRRPGRGRRRPRAREGGGLGRARRWQRWRPSRPPPTATRWRRWPGSPRTGARDDAGGGSSARGRTSAGIPARWDDLASFVRFLEARGALVRIAREVDPVLEVSAIAQQVMRAEGPALLFERVKGSRFPLLINTYATRARMSLGARRLRPRRARARDPRAGEVAAPGGPARQGPHAAEARARRHGDAEDRAHRRRARRWSRPTSTSASCRSSRPGRRTAGRTSRCRW